MEWYEIVANLVTVTAAALSALAAWRAVNAARESVEVAQQSLDVAKQAMSENRVSPLTQELIQRGCQVLLQVLEHRGKFERCFRTAFETAQQKQAAFAQLRESGEQVSRAIFEMQQLRPGLHDAAAAWRRAQLVDDSFSNPENALLRLDEELSQRLSEGFEKEACSAADAIRAWLNQGCPEAVAA